MPTIKTNLTEMKSATVDRISLVSKAASRIPLRIIKEDRTMSNPLKTLDLAQVFKGKQQSVPTIVGVVTMKGERLEAVKKAAAEAGFKVDVITENTDGSVVLKQADAQEGEALVVIKMCDDVALTMKGFSPYGMSMDAEDGASFADMCSAQGFYPDVSTMMDVLQSSVMSAAYKSDTPDTAAELVSKMFDEAKAYATSMLKALPAAAFKMEKALKSGAPNANGSMETGNPPPAGLMGDKKPTGNLGATLVKDPIAGGAPNGESAASGTGDGSGVARKADMTCPKGMDSAKFAKMSDAEKAKAIEDAKDGGADDANENADGTKKTAKADAGAELSKMLSEGLKSLGESLTLQLNSGLATVNKSVDGLKSTVEGLGTKVTEVEGVAKAAQQAVKGTVLGSDAGDDATQTQKSDRSGYRGREIDTGFAPRRRPAAR